MPRSAPEAKTRIHSHAAGHHPNRGPRDPRGRACLTETEQRVLSPPRLLGAGLAEGQARQAPEPHSLVTTGRSMGPCKGPGTPGRTGRDHRDSPPNSISQWRGHWAQWGLHDLCHLWGDGGSRGGSCAGQGREPSSSGDSLPHCWGTGTGPHASRGICERSETRVRSRCPCPLVQQGGRKEASPTSVSLLTREGADHSCSFTAGGPRTSVGGCQPALATRPGFQKPTVRYRLQGQG